MKIVYHPLMLESYDRTPAGAAGRLESAVEVLSKRKGYEFIEPAPASDEDIIRAHSSRHIERIKADSDSRKEGLLEKLARLAAGGAILTGELALSGTPAFGLIRPPGHHASRSSYWGFCYYSNMAIALLNLKARGLIQSAFVLDFDLHVGDGTINILGEKKAFTIHNPSGRGDESFLTDIQAALRKASEYDIIAASAGFDQYVDDWGGNISTSGFNRIGQIMHEFAEERCEGRCFGILEGGYNFEDLGKNALAFCEGMQGKKMS
ncbi:MAG: histone deacetylase family protein [Candidatus Thorarchaeota archaeon]|nr:histone deacetylase family protein [Candidatus Thorarchaeota archaeon]